jgi:DNA-binding transcriptional LysR family regulator
MPRLEVIEAFLEAARAPNFRTAAGRCALSSTAFTRRIQAFTTYAGRNVFERHAGGMRLTDAGREYLAALEPAYREMRRVALEITAGRPAQKVALSLSHSLAVGWLIPRLERFRSRHPQIDVSIQTIRTAEAVRSGDADLGLCASDVDVAGLHAKHLLDIFVSPVACPRIAAKVGDGAHALEAFPLLGLAHHPNLWSWWAGEAGLRCGSLKETTRFDMAHALYEATAGGFGIAIGIGVLVRPHLQSGRLVELDLPSVRFPGGYRLVARTSRMRNPAVSAFWNWLVEEGCARRPEGHPDRLPDPAPAAQHAAAVRA